MTINLAISVDIEEVDSLYAREKISEYIMQLKAYWVKDVIITNVQE